MSQFSSKEPSPSHAYYSAGVADPAPSPRPGSRTFRITTGSIEHSKLTRVDLPLDYVVEAELADYQDGLDGALARGLDAAAYAASQEDRAIWEEVEPGARCRLVAIIRPRPDGEPLVIYPDEWPEPPVPLTDDQKMALTNLRVLGPEEFFARVFLTGVFGYIRDAVDRLGRDAVCYLHDVAERERAQSREATGPG